MTVPSETNRSGPYNGNGSTTVFGYGFRIVDEDHLRVIKTSALGVETILTIDADYIVSDVGEAAGGQIALTVAPASGETITILRNIPFTQDTDLENQGAYYAETVEDAFDLAAMRDQQLAEEIGRSIRVPASTDPDADLQLPAPEAGKIISWNAAANGLQNLSPSELSSVVAYGTAKADIFTGDGVTTVFALGSNPAALNNLDVSIGGVAQLPGIDYTWTSGVNITFTTAPANGVKVLVRYMQALAQGVTEAVLVSTDDGSNVQVALDGKASINLSNVSVVDFFLSQDVLTYPIGNELETYSQFNVFASDRRNDKREFIFNFSANFSRGPTGGGPYEYEDHKTLLYGGVNMHLDCRKAWVLNPLITIKPDCVDPQFVCNTEFDINNFSGRNFGDLDGAAGLPGPSAYGVMVAGSNATGNRITGGYLLLSTPGAPVFNRGYIVGPNSVVQAAFDDYSSAASSYRDSGSHVIGINLQGTYSSAGITVSGDAVAAINLTGTNSLAGIVEGSTSPIGLMLNGTYSTTPITFGTLPRNFANDAAAGAAVPSIPVGGIYRNGSALMVRAA